MYGRKLFRILGTTIATVVVVLLLTIVVGLLTSAGLFGPFAKSWIREHADNVLDLYTTDAYFLRTGIAAVSAAIAFFGAAYTMMLNWHYSELSLPRRVKEYLEQDHSDERPELEAALVTSRNGKMSPNWDNASATATTFSRFFRLFTRSTPEEQMSALARSLGETRGEYDVVQTAYNFSCEKLLVTHLVRGHTYVGDQQYDKALAEYRSAAVVIPSDARPLSAAAGCLRSLARSDEEGALLEELCQIAQRKNNNLLLAQSLRRQAEILKDRHDPVSLNEARRKLDQAIKLLGPNANIDDPRTLELGRCQTLFCEVQIERDRPGRLQTMVQSAVAILSSIDDFALADEFSSPPYGKTRVTAMKRSYFGHDVADRDSSGDDDS